MEYRDATAAVIGAGDFIGAAVAKKFASEGFTVFAGRRKGEKLAPLVAEIEAAGGRVVGRSLDARKEEEITAFLQDADATAPLEDDGADAAPYCDLGPHAVRPQPVDLAIF